MTRTRIWFVHDYTNGRERILRSEEANMKNWETASPLAKLLASRKFLLMVLDVFVTLGLYFATKYLNPSGVDDIKQVILLLQPVVVTIILAIAHEDAAQANLNAAQLRLDVAELELEAASK